MSRAQWPATGGRRLGSSKEEEESDDDFSSPVRARPTTIAAARGGRGGGGRGARGARGGRVLVAGAATRGTTAAARGGGVRRGRTTTAGPTAAAATPSPSASSEPTTDAELSDEDDFRRGRLGAVSGRRTSTHDTPSSDESEETEEDDDPSIIEIDASNHVRRLAAAGRAITAARGQRGGLARGASTSRGTTRGGRGVAGVARGARRGAASTSTAPIFGGRQATQVRTATARARGGRASGARAGATTAAATAGRAARIAVFTTAYESDEDEVGEGMTLSDLEDEEDGDDLDMFSDLDEDDVDQDIIALDDSLREFLDDDDDDLLTDSEEDDDGPEDGDLTLGDETFSREVEEFELMEERDNAASRKAEEALRKREDKEEKENKSAVRTDMFGSCTVCAEDEVVDPIGCIYCAGFIGCRKCANRWYRMSKEQDDDKIASCPLCRHQWNSPFPEVGDMLDLVKTA